MTSKQKFPASGYYAVIFSSTKSDDLEGYAEMDEKTMKLAEEQPGYLGHEVVANGKQSIFISYWESREAIDHWSRHSVHILAKSSAPTWYRRYLSQICRVENSREFNN